MIGIFKLVNTSNDKIYIGSSKDISNRFNELIANSKRTFKNKLYIEEAILEFGEDSFELSILEELENELQLTERKTYWINIFDSDITGYNRMKYIKAEDFVMPFGKHQDVIFSNIPIDYFRWLSKQCWMNDKNKQSLKRKLKLFFQLVKEKQIKYDMTNDTI